jgi:FtsP/CotA-like multicopper oxidase with cupredoxin domain
LTFQVDAVLSADDDIHPLHLHRHTFELTRVGGKPTAGVMKDVVMLGGFREIEFDFVANNPGLTLQHFTHEGSRPASA